MAANQSNLTPEQRLDEMCALKWRQHAGGEPRIGAWPISLTRAVALDLLARLDAAEAPCVWTFTDDHEEAWDGTCGVKWCFIEGGAIENGVNFCPGCGHPVQVKQEEDSHD